jgi:hypothetical protein
MVVIVKVVDRYPFNSPWIRGLIVRYWLPVWFATNSIVALVHSAQDTSLLFFDARLYIEATKEWLAGGDPWQVSLAGNYFAAPPPSLIPLAPLAMLPTDIGVAVVASLVIVGAVASVRLLRLPWWWILFPPLVQCVLSANVHGLLIPLIVLPGGALAILFKIYSGVPLAIMGRWRALLTAAVVLLVTIPILPWSTYLQDFAEINANLATQTKHHIPVVVLIALSPLVLVGLTMVGRSRAAWMATLALWPSQQYYYGTFVMPVGSAAAAAIVALPVTGSGLIALAVLAALEWRSGTRPGWRPRVSTRVPLGPSAR